MKSVSALIAEAVRLHREAASHAEAARVAMQRIPADGVAGQAVQQQQAMATHLAQLAAGLTPGWLGAPLDMPDYDRALAADAKLGQPVMVRLGEAVAAPGARFPVVVPFLGAGHVRIDLDARDRRGLDLFRGLLLRVSAALPAEALQVLPVDGATLGAAFAAFRPLVDAGVWPAPVSDAEGLRVVLTRAEEQVAEAQGGARNLPYLLIACTAMPNGVSAAEHARLAAIAHAGPSARVHLLMTGYQPMRQPGDPAAAHWDHTTVVSAQPGTGLLLVSEPPGPQRFDHNGGGICAPVEPDLAPDPQLIASVTRQLSVAHQQVHAVTFASLMPQHLWSQDSATGLTTRVGRGPRDWCDLTLGDATPHWLISGRTGSGKTVFLLNVLYGLASRYSPDELGMYLLDFKEGVSFTEFTPTPSDPTWIPHARTVGIESDREYGLAILQGLAQEMTRRANMFKRAGVTRLPELRASQADVAMPRLVVVIDEFHVLFTGNDSIATQAAAVLEDLARKGRSYGIHLILASQTISGVEALFIKADSIFGQFPLRVALAGGSGILDTFNTAADNLPLGTAIINTAAGAADANLHVTFPDAPAEPVRAQRQKLWDARPPGDQPPAVFAGYAEYHLADDPAAQALSPGVRRRVALVGRSVDIGLPPAGFTLDATPGRHIAVLGTDPAGADILHACAVSLARQHHPGDATFILAPLVPAADRACDQAAAEITAAGHTCQIVAVGELPRLLRELIASASNDPAARRDAAARPRYLLLFAADAASSLLNTTIDPESGLTGIEDLRTVLRHGPSHGVHVIGWWRTVSRFTEDTGGHQGREDIAGLVILNLAGEQLHALTGDYQLAWQPRPNRALLIDRHDHRQQLIVPYLLPSAGQHDMTAVIR